MLSERKQIEKPTHVVWFHLHKLFRINCTQWSKPVIYALRRQKKSYMGDRVRFWLKNKPQVMAIIS